LESKTMNPKKL